MPLYEYECEACGLRFEVIQKFSDPPVETCRTCGGPVQKLLSSPAIQFKGSGWYITDYARKGKEGSSGSGSEGSSGSSGSGSSGSGSSGSGSSGSGSSGSGSSGSSGSGAAAKKSD